MSDRTLLIAPAFVERMRQIVGSPQAEPRTEFFGIRVCVSDAVPDPPGFALVPLPSVAEQARMAFAGETLIEWIADQFKRKTKK